MGDLSKCHTCGRDLVKNEKLSASFTRLFEVGPLEAYFCSECVDDIYVLSENKLYSKDEWREKRQGLLKAKQRPV